jgi:hypothetical protein
MIRKVGRKYILKSKTSGCKLGEFTSKKAALKRERQINYFKHNVK